MPLYSLMRDRKGVEPDGRGGGEELKEVEGKTVKNISNKKNLFSITEKIKRKKSYLLDSMTSYHNGNFYSWKY